MSPTPRPTGRTVVARSLMIAACAASIAACASKKAPPPVPPIPPPSSGGYGDPPPPPPSGGVESSNIGAPAPGSERDFIVNAGDRIYFDYNAYSVSGDGQRILDAQAQWLQRYPAVQVRIEGNCDERGTREFNLALGARRAEAVKAYLISRGVSAARIGTISFGKERPLDPGTSEDAYAKNRNGHTALTSGARVGGAYQ